MGCTVLIGQSIGQKDEKTAARTIGSALWLFVLIGLTISVLLYLFSGNVASAMNAPSEALGQTKDYIRICAVGMVFIGLFNAVCGIFRGMGDSKTPLKLMLIACILHILGDIVLVGFFQWNSNGAAISTVVAEASSVIFAFISIAKRGFIFPVGKKDLLPYKREIQRILLYGLPISAQEALTGLSFMVILAILNGFGLIDSAGVGVAEKICALMFLVPGTFMSAVSAFTAQNVGARKYGRAKSSMYCGMLCSFAVGLVVFFISFFHGDWLSGFFTMDQAVILASADYLKSYSIDCIIVGFHFCMMGYLNGNGKTFLTSLIGILSTFLIRIPFAYIMSKMEGATLFQVGFATPLASVFAILIATVCVRSIIKQQETLDKHSHYSPLAPERRILIHLSGFSLFPTIQPH